mmetsp:Transcript_2446/g.6757  ORF Transcript_2446/g.6757 Transcript_2446/m.6757 type:complete len:208 (-) Transcript_2446:610-1233(-)
MYSEDHLCVLWLTTKSNLRQTRDKVQRSLNPRASRTGPSKSSSGRTSMMRASFCLCLLFLFFWAALAMAGAPLVLLRLDDPEEDPEASIGGTAVLLAFFHAPTLTPLRLLLTLAGMPSVSGRGNGTVPLLFCLDLLDLDLVTTLALPTSSGWPASWPSPGPTTPCSWFGNKDAVSLLAPRSTSLSSIVSPLGAPCVVVVELVPVRGP